MTSLKELLGYLKPYRLFAILGPLLMCIEVTMDLLQPTIMQHIIDTGIADNDNAYVTRMGIFMLVAAIIGLIGGVGSSIYSTEAAVNFASDIRRDVFLRTGQFSSRNTDSFGIGKLITIVTSDITSVQTAIMMTLRVFVRGPLLFIGSVIIVWFTARELFFILLVMVPLLVGCIFFLSLRAGKLFKKVQEAIDKVNTKLQETLAGIRVIKAFDRQDFEKDGFKTIIHRLTKVNLTAEQVIVTLMPITLFIVNMSIVGAMWFGAIKVENGVLEVGVILAFINYLTIIMNAIMSSTHVLMQITRSFPSAERIKRVLDTDLDITSPDAPVFRNASKGEVEFKHVSYSYSKNGEYVLNDLSFHARSGEKIGIIGSTGSGKSTLIKLVPRLYDADEGEVLIDGIPIQHYSLQELRMAIGFIPQKALLFSGSITENLRFGKEEATTEDLINAAKDAAALEFIEKLDQEFTYPLTQGATNLSGGQKQRIAIARALIRKPAILILDDSTSAVDSISEASIQKSLKLNFPQTTVLMIAAKISSIMDADQILVLEDGRIESCGTHQQLLNSSQVYRDIYVTQSGREAVVSE